MTRLAQSFQNFLMDPFQRSLFLFLLLLYGGLLLWGEIPSFQPLDEKIAVHYFFHPQCPHCQAQQPFNRELKRKYPQIRWLEHDLSQPQEAARFSETASRYGLPPSGRGIPATFIGDFHFIGFDRPETTGKEIEEALKKFLTGQDRGGTSTRVEGENIVRLPLWGAWDVRHSSLGPLAVVLGLIDGFNPCAMWVLVYLISLILTLKDKTKIWFLVGSFVLASGILYFLFLAAWLNVFLWIGFLRPLTLLVGVFALGVGILNLREFFSTPKALVCEVGDSGSRRKTMDRVARIVASPLNFTAVAGMVVLAFLVNSIEFVCSAGIPAIFTHVLTLHPLSPLQYYGYLFLYDFFFMLDDLVIFGLAAFAVSTPWGERYARWGKLVGGGILLVLGILLTFFPHQLR